MDDISFEVWMAHGDADDFLAALHAQGLATSSTGPLQQRSGEPSDATVIIAVSGAIFAIAKALAAYFKSKEKCIKVSTPESTFYVKNYTPIEVARIAQAGNHVVLTDRPKDDQPADT